MTDERGHETGQSVVFTSLTIESEKLVSTVWLPFARQVGNALIQTEQILFDFMSVAG
ncbi:hypothetical protein HMPREF9442_00284 [Paraprevotella xylaniphila YIT 11841]|uniref:Uncharacterized protein n=1 Tax=Paraprevotella xylaniphila YIT 11841 TaxID=762982 RepID=F3QQ46_9BACT|nr:hypothetical protein HMPREF9442_00284 [Paraprevotella xylaniphila YIT 11841]